MNTTEVLFLNRDLSWLSFNKRVLDIAMQENLPIYSRIKFMAIYLSNLDEFYKVRLSKYLNSNKEHNTRYAYKTKTLSKILKQITNEQKIFHELFENKIIQELKNNNINIYYRTELLDIHKEFVKNFFLDKLLAYLHPIFLNNTKNQTFIENNELYFIVKLYEKSSNKDQFAIIHIPVRKHGRFIKLPNKEQEVYYMFVDDIIKTHIKVLFPGYKTSNIYSFKLTRDADLLIINEFEGDLIKKIEKNLDNREKGKPSLFVYDNEMPEEFITFLTEHLKLNQLELTQGYRYHNLSDLFSLPNPKAPNLSVTTPTPLQITSLNKSNSIFKSISKKDRLLHFPYHSYQYVLRFLNQAAVNPNVVQIKTTQYRVAENSAIVDALINASLNGKDVTVFVEVKARFDELANIESARKMKKAGVKIIYSIPGLKVHAKVALVISNIDKDDYAFISTGNFNENTAKIYTDSGLFTTNKNTIRELLLLFDYLQDQTKKPTFKKLLIGKFNLKSDLIKLIDTEIHNAENNARSHIIIKLNSLQNKTMIRKLYQASKAGVKVDLIIRGICCLNPLTEDATNINLIRIVDNFLEHSRVYFFHNNGNEKIFLSSADWMNRNLNRRIECAFPVDNEKMKEEIKNMLDLQLKDNTNATYTDKNMNNIKISSTKKKLNSQHEIYKLLSLKQNTIL